MPPLQLWDFVVGCDENNLAQTSLNAPGCADVLLAGRKGIALD
jgi:hypothetical protein